MELSAAHWIYLARTALIIAVMAARKNVIIRAAAAALATAWAFTGAWQQACNRYLTPA
jgi:hypothetical protein